MLLSKSTKELLAVSFMTFDFFLTGPIAILILIMLLFTPFFWITIGYLIWMYLDRFTPNNGGRRSIWLRNWARNLPIWNHARDYFPVKMILESDKVKLNPDNNYILLNHPHGIMCAGAFLNFSTEANNFGAIFPGMSFVSCMLETMFKLPIRRDLMLAIGAQGVNRETFDYHLGGKKTGYIMGVVVGGAREALDAISGKMDLTLKNRRGIIRLAIKHGAHLIPTISFGENEIFEQKLTNFEFVRKLQDKFLSLAGFSTPIIHGRGYFNFNFGFLPFRRPITTVVGEPVMVTKNPKPSQDQVTRLQEEYISKLRQLYNDHKDKLGFGNVKLVIK